MERKWVQSGIEPPLSELMSDPIVHLLMLSHNITSQDVWSAIAPYWGRPRREQPSVVIDEIATTETLPSCHAPPSTRACGSKKDVGSESSLGRSGRGTMATHREN